MGSGWTKAGQGLGYIPSDEKLVLNRMGLLWEARSVEEQSLSQGAGRPWWWGS